LTQRGIVTDINDNKISVLVAKVSMCGENCASCKGCAPSSQTAYAINETQETLHIGDSVLLETQTDRVIGMAAVVYCLPLLCLFAAYFIAAYALQSELYCALIALGAALLSLLLLRILDRHIKKKNTFLVRITKILKKNNA